MARCSSKSSQALMGLTSIIVQCGRRHSALQFRSYASQASKTTLWLGSTRTSSATFHSTPINLDKRRKGFFSSKAPLKQPPAHQQGPEARTPENGRLAEKRPEQGTYENPSQVSRRSKRTSAATTSLRRVAVEAQRSRDGKERTHTQISGRETYKTVTAICAAQEYHLTRVVQILEDFGLEIDPYATKLYPQVVHVVLPFQVAPVDDEGAKTGAGDLFVFPSGTVVAWGIPEKTLSQLVSKALKPAASSPLLKFEEEDLEYTEDANKENSSIHGDRIVLGIKPRSDSQQTDMDELDPETGIQNRNLDSVLTKIAFSSGLARSTRLAVLESLLANYFESTKSIPEVLSRGRHMPFTRSFISQKTGQLLSIRAQLNLYSELTDSLPDLFWDSRHELGLEGSFDQVSKALDTNIRIKILNEKMDYAQEIASVLRQQLSERHGARLEWIIILLIAVEVVLAIDKEVKEYRERKVTEAGFEVVPRNSDST